MKLHLLKIPALLSAAGLLAAGCSSNDMGGSSERSHSTSTGSAKSMSSADARFVRDAASSGLAEVQMGQLVQQKGQSEALKQFGRQLVSDHSQANQELTALASQKGLDVPTQLKADDQQPITRLSSSSGAEFDQLAKQEAIKAHQKAIAQFRSAQNTVKDPELKAFIQKTLPVLEKHLQHAEGLSSSETSTEQGGSESLEGRGVQGSGSSSSKTMNDQGSSTDLERGAENQTDQLSPGSQPEPDSASPAIPE